MLSELFKACSDATRRRILTTLVQEGPTRVTDLSEQFVMSLNAVSKHIKVLEKSGLIKRNTIGRVHLIEANLESTKLVEDWFKELRLIWELRLDKLTDILEQKHE